MFELIGFIVIYIVLFAATIIQIIEFNNMIFWLHLRVRITFNIVCALITIYGWWWFFNY